MRILVTGATGFVGINTIRVLEKEGHSVVALVRESSAIGRLPEETDVVTGDITNLDSLMCATKDVSAVAHLAAVHSLHVGDQQDRSEDLPDRMQRVNVEGTENVIKAANKSGVDSVVFTSTYNAHPRAPPNPNPYVRSKEAAGNLFTEGEHDFEYAILYPTNIIGPLDFRLNQFADFWTVASNQVLIPPLYRPGGRNIVHVSDVAESIRFGVANSTDERYFVTGPNLDGREFYKRIGTAIDTDTYILPLPLFILKTCFAPIADFVHNRGVVAFDGSYFRDWSESDIPPAHENKAPVKQQSTQKIFDKTAEWYEKAGLL